MRLIIVYVGLLLFGISAAAAEEASATSTTFSQWVKINPIAPLWDCKGKCAATIFAGPLLDTDMRKVAGLNTFVPPWKYAYAKGGLVGGALSQVLVEFKNYADFEGEVGLGQRFGGLHETEGWVALYFRWKWFPWNKFITTTVAVSTGLSYASGIPEYEVGKSVVGYGSNLLHYLSPEFTFALPSKPDWEFLIRAHHRSGGGILWGYTPMFKGVYGGTQYLVFGLRHRF